jgi:hypothetical protein
LSSILCYTALFQGGRFLNVGYIMLLQPYSKLHTVSRCRMFCTSSCHRNQENPKMFHKALFDRRLQFIIACNINKNLKRMRMNEQL